MGFEKKTAAARARAGKYRVGYHGTISGYPNNDLDNRFTIVVIGTVTAYWEGRDYAIITVQKPSIKGVPGEKVNVYR